MSRFDYVKYDGKAVAQQANFKEKFENLEFDLKQEVKEGRYVSLAITALEEAYAWIGKAIRDDQIVRNGRTSLQEERGES